MLSLSVGKEGVHSDSRAQRRAVAVTLYSEVITLFAERSSLVLLHRPKTCCRRVQSRGGGTAPVAARELQSTARFVSDTSSPPGKFYCPLFSSLIGRLTSLEPTGSLSVYCEWSHFAGGQKLTYELRYAVAPSACNVPRPDISSPVVQVRARLAVRLTEHGEVGDSKCSATRDSRTCDKKKCAR